MTRFENIKLTAEILQDIYAYLEQRVEDKTKRYEVVGKSDKQKTSWKTGELMWEDEEHTIPVYENVYDYVTYDVENLDEADRNFVEVVRRIQKDLEKLLK